MPLDELIIYELHTGTFTGAGTFEAIIPHLAYLKDEVGVTAIELMPVAQFPGSRNWGYDGVHPFAVQASYGGPEELMMSRSETISRAWNITAGGDGWRATAPTRETR